MWLRCFVSVADTRCQHLMLCSAFSKSSIIGRTFKYRLPSTCLNCRHLSRSFQLSNKSQYVYDPDADSFVHRSHITKIRSNQSEHNYNNQNETEKPSFKSIMKGFFRNLFWITGAIVWIGVTFVIFFVDFHESSEFNLQLKDAEEEVRLFAFYDIVQNQTDLANILRKSKDQDSSDELEKCSRLKEEALNKALNQIKKQNVITEKLGEPVQLLGYRAAGKLDQMVKHFQYLTQYGIEKLHQEVSANNMWIAECLLEGPEGIITLFLEFKKTSRKQEEEWVLSKVVVEPLVTTGTYLLNLSASSHESVKFTD